MRLIAQCGECKRQYNAEGHQPGASFHCHCGTVVKVPSPNQGMEAAVVRCSSCGAPRAQEATSCGYCHSDFTLAEQDRGTVCPSCMTRVSDAADFCHSCGNRLAVQDSAGEKSDLVCPACKEEERSLFSRQLGSTGVNVFECDCCAGMWLGHGCFDHVQQKASEGSIPDFTGGDQNKAKNTVSTNTDWSYRKCPECDNMMRRTNFGRRSGVIVDICRDHGTWFDDQELASIVEWIRSGGAQQQREYERQQDEFQKVAAQSATVTSFTGDNFGDVRDDDRFGAGDMFSTIASIFG